MNRSGRRKKGEREQNPGLSKEREFLQARLAAIDRDRGDREQTRTTGDNTPASDPVDTIQENMAKEESLATRGAIVQRLRALVKAEQKVQEGTYGLCEVCGQPIPPARLRAVPEAVLCVLCAEAEEHRLSRRA